MPVPVWLDTDPGIDDAVAIGLAARSPEIVLAGVSTTYGNTSVDKATRNARHLLQRVGRDDVPVWSGAAGPLCRPPQYAEETHGPEGFGYAGELPAWRPERVEAPQRLLTALATAPDPLHVVALGPLTNLALALALDAPLCRRQIAQMIWMGGSAGAPGNTTPVSEFNAWCDPEAVRAVLLHSRAPGDGSEGIPLSIVGLDVTRQMLLPAADVERACAGGAEVRWWGDLWRFYVEFHRQYEGLDGCILNDPLAVALLLHPEWGQALPVRVDVDCGDGLTRGQTICDRFGLTGKPANAAVYLSVDAGQAMRFSLQRATGGIDL